MLEDVLKKLGIIKYEESEKNYYLFKIRHATIIFNGVVYKRKRITKKKNAFQELSDLENSQTALFVAYCKALNFLSNNYWVTISFNAQESKTLIVICPKTNKSKIVFQELHDDKYSAVFSAYLTLS